MSTPETLLALEHVASFARERALIVGAFEPSLAETLAARASTVTVFQTDARAARAHAHLPRTITGAWLDEGTFDVAILLLPKEVARLRMLLAMARARIAPGGLVLLAGHNRAGIKGAGKHLRAAVGAERVLGYGHHCRLLAAAATGEATTTSLDDWRTTFDARGLTIVSYPGVFAHGALDAGTAMLLDALEIPNGARALDVGSGCGIIAAHLAAGGARVEALDVDAVAVAATRATLAANDLNAEVRHSDIYERAGSGYDLIVTNPPFHKGVRTTSSVAERIIREAPAHLARGGALWVVANRFLDYMPAFRDGFGGVQLIAEDARYRVWRAHT